MARRLHDYTVRFELYVVPSGNQAAYWNPSDTKPVWYDPVRKYRYLALQAGDDDQLLHVNMDNYPFMDRPYHVDTVYVPITQNTSIQKLLVSNGTLHRNYVVDTIQAVLLRHCVQTVTDGYRYDRDDNLVIDLTRANKKVIKNDITRYNPFFLRLQLGNMAFSR